MAISSLMILYMFSLNLSVQSDPCILNSVILNAEKRSAGYPLTFGIDTPINDAFLASGWYRINGNLGDRMPTSEPGPLRCGTWYPIWLNDALPTVADGLVSKKVCMQSFTQYCAAYWLIDIINCPGNFFVYKLVQSSYQKSAYCFGTGPVKCPVGESSETGYYPGCDANYPKMATVSPMVQPGLASGPERVPGFGYSLVTMFRCQFVEPPGLSYVYDVRWTINGDFIVLHKSKTYTNIAETDLKEDLWVGKYFLPMLVECSIRLRFSVGSTPGPYFNSSIFTAGLFPEKNLYQVKEGETIQIQLKSTFPKGCIGHEQHHREECVFQIKIVQPYYQTKPQTCQNSVIQDDLKFVHENINCVLTIKSWGWENPITINVTGYINGNYDSKDRTTYIKFNSSIDDPDFPEPWYGVDIPAITVVVTDKEHQLAGRICRSVNDPHFTTTDGQYYDYHEPGEFIMYRHKTKPYAVHALYSKCTVYGATCNCGIAIRSGQSLFVLRTCSEVSWYYTNTHNPFIEYRTCDDSNMVIQEYGNGYKVTLPIGTEIIFELVYYYYWWLAGHYISYIHIKPSLLDVANAEGLCGYVTEGYGDTSDDFQLRDGTTLPNSYTNIYTFARSWSVQAANERFFTNEPVFLSEPMTNLQQYCACANISDVTRSKDLSLNCSLSEPLQSCLEQKARFSNFHTTCSHGSRRKRSLSDDVIDVKEVVINTTLNVEIPPEKKTEWPEGWTEELARKTCESSIGKIMTDEIVQVSRIGLDEPIRNCISDIQMSGSTVFLKDAIKAVMVAAVTEISRNRSLFEDQDNPEPGKNSSLGYTLLNSLCPSNCSNHGICQQGECICDKWYTKEDCSEDLSRPPMNISLPQSGLCNTRERLCLQTNINGIFYSRDIWCQRRHFKIFSNNTVIYSSSLDFVNATYRNTFLVSCELSSGRKRRSLTEQIIAEGYEISLSNDGETFGDNVKILIYDQSCYTCDAINITCVGLDTCPDLTTPIQTTTILTPTTVPTIPTISTDLNVATTTTTTATSPTTTTTTTTTTTATSPTTGTTTTTAAIPTTATTTTTIITTPTAATTTTTTAASPTTPTTTTTTAASPTTATTTTTTATTTTLATTTTTTSIVSTTATTTPKTTTTHIIATTPPTSTIVPTTDGTNTYSTITTVTTHAIAKTTPTTTSYMPTTSTTTGISTLSKTTAIQITATATTRTTTAQLTTFTTPKISSTKPSTTSTSSTVTEVTSFTSVNGTEQLRNRNGINDFELSTATLVGIIISGILVAVALCTGAFCFYKKKRVSKGRKEDDRSDNEHSGTFEPTTGNSYLYNTANTQHKEHSFASIADLSIGIDCNEKRQKQAVDLFEPIPDY